MSWAYGQWIDGDGSTPDAPDTEFFCANTLDDIFLSDQALAEFAIFLPDGDGTWASTDTISPFEVCTLSLFCDISWKDIAWMVVSRITGPPIILVGPHGMPGNVHRVRVQCSMPGGARGCAGVISARVAENCVGVRRVTGLCSEATTVITQRSVMLSHPGGVCLQRDGRAIWVRLRHTPRDGGGRRLVRARTAWTPLMSCVHFER